MSYRLKVVTLWFAIVAAVSCEPSTQPVVVQDPPPNAPSGLSATAMSSSAVTLSWTDASGDELQFSIERCAGASCANFTHFQNAPANATAYLDISVVGGSSYSYRVRASNAVGSSAFSNTATVATPPAGAIPAPPTNFAATAVTSSQINLSWTDVATTEDGFRVERCQGTGCTNWNLYGTTLTPNGNAMIISSLQASTTYRFRIQSYNGTGGSAFVGPVEATTLPAATVPVAPSGLTATAVSSSRINLSWADNSNNEDAFVVERCQGGGCASFAVIGTTPSGTWADQGRSASTSYSYRVKATNGAGSSPYSAVATATTQPAATIPAAPSGLTATAMSSSTIALAWTDNANNEDEFLIERCSGAGCVNFSLLANLPANVRTYLHSSLSPSTTYSYRVQARNGAGGSAFATATTSTTLSDPPAPPTGVLAVAVSTSQINLSWVDASTNETAFKVDRCTGAGCSTFAEIASLPAGTTSYQNTGLNAATTYSYRVRAFNSSWSTSTSVATATTFAATPLIVLSPTSRSFSGTAGGTAPASQAVQVSNGGGGTLNGLSRTIAYQAGQTTGWLTASLSGMVAPVTLTLTANPTTLAAGTYNATVSIQSTAAGTTPRTVTVTFTVAPGTPTTPTTLRIINDLPGGIIGGGNWTQLNTVIRVRIGPTSASVINFTAQARELLFNGDETSNANLALHIPPGTQGNLDVSSQTGPYWVFIQTGWWEFFDDLQLWVKHPAQVMACDGQQLAYKWVAFRVTAPFGAPEIIKLSEFLPAGSYGPPFCP